jgi:hypothetical protein
MAERVAPKAAIVLDIQDRQPIAHAMAITDKIRLAMPMAISGLST